MQGSLMRQDGFLPSTWHNLSEIHGSSEGTHRKEADDPVLRGFKTVVSLALFGLGCQAVATEFPEPDAECYGAHRGLFVYTCIVLGLRASRVIAGGETRALEDGVFVLYNWVMFGVTMRNGCLDSRMDGRARWASGLMYADFAGTIVGLVASLVVIGVNCARPGFASIFGGRGR